MGGGSVNADRHGHVFAMSCSVISVFPGFNPESAVLGDIHIPTSGYCGNVSSNNDTAIGGYGKSGPRVVPIGRPIDSRGP